MLRLNNKELMEKVEGIESFAIKAIRSNETLNKLYLKMINEDKEVYQHSINVCRVAVLLGVCYNLSLEEQINLAIGSLVHDIGKIYLNKDILYKPEKLSDDEHIFIEAHTSIGYKLVKEVDVNNIVLEIIKSHHEKVNGIGYPEGLHSPQISIYVQLVTIADIFDALISPRVYKEPYSMDEVFKILEGDKGLNVVAVGILEDLLRRYEPEIV